MFKKRKRVFHNLHKLCMFDLSSPLTVNTACATFRRIFVRWLDAVLGSTADRPCLVWHFRGDLQNEAIFISPVITLRLGLLVFTSSRFSKDSQKSKNPTILNIYFCLHCSSYSDCQTGGQKSTRISIYFFIFFFYCITLMITIKDAPYCKHELNAVWVWTQLCQLSTSSLNIFPIAHQSPIRQ